MVCCSICMRMYRSKDIATGSSFMAITMEFSDLFWMPRRALSTIHAQKTIDASITRIILRYRHSISKQDG